MHQSNRLLAIVLSAVMLLSVVGAGMVVADEDENGDELSMEVEQDGDVHVTLTDEAGDGIADHVVNVTVGDENVSYAETGEHETDENGTVVLAAPEVALNATFSADGAAEAQTVELAPVEDEDAEDDDRADEPFGLQVSAFVHGLLGGDGDENESVGQQVSAFVTQNNPGNAPDHADQGNSSGPPEHAGNDNETGQPDRTGNASGPPAHAGGADEQSGPPEHAGADGDDESNGTSAEAAASASASVTVGN